MSQQNNCDNELLIIKQAIESCMTKEIDQQDYTMNLICCMASMHEHICRHFEKRQSENKS